MDLMHRAVWRLVAHAVGLVSALATCSRGAPAPSPAPTPAPASASASAAAAAVTLSPDERRRVLDAIPPLIDAHYVFPDVGRATIAAFREHVARGDYDRFTEPLPFARAVTDDLRATSHDLHFYLRYTGEPVDAPSRAEEEEHRRLLAAAGFVSVERLAGGVAVLRVDSFIRPPDDPGVLEAYAQRMTEVADAPALILDLRHNHGGDPATVALFVSYFLGPPAVRLIDFWNRDNGQSFTTWTRAAVPGRRFGTDKPLFVLASHDTISGGEEAAYDLKVYKRATIVGEATVGAANPADRHPVSEHFRLAVPFARPTSPVTHANWEGAGVAPDVVVPADDALHEAHARALRALNDRRPSP
jgi:hypothetical protein